MGSNPSNPNYRNTTKYTSETIKNWNCSLVNGTKVTVNGIAEVGENNCEQDFVRMSALGVASTENDYYLASRHIENTGDRLIFGVDNVNSNGIFCDSGLLDAYSSGNAYAYSSECAVRPVVKISLNS